MITGIQYVIAALNYLLAKLKTMYIDQIASLYDILIFLICISVVTFMFRRITHANK